MIKRLTTLSFDAQGHPFDIPAIKENETIEFDRPITIFVGDNGSGKSTLLHAIAYASDSIHVARQSMDDPYFADVRHLAKRMRLVHDVKDRKGFLFSGEDFIAYINRLKDMKRGLEEDLAQMEHDFRHKSEYVRNLALGPIRGELHRLASTYDGDLEQRSHGEGFLTFFRARMHQRGVYLLDEPETPLSAVNQYQLMVLLTDLARDGSQIILATHSPILMALEQARIYQFDRSGIHAIEYQDIETVQFTRAFLNDPTNYTRRI